MGHKTFVRSKILLILEDTQFLMNIKIFFAIASYTFLLKFIYFLRQGLFESIIWTKKINGLKKI